MFNHLVLSPLFPLNGEALFQCCKSDLGIYCLFFLLLPLSLFTGKEICLASPSVSLSAYLFELVTPGNLSAWICKPLSSRHRNHMWSGEANFDRLDNF